MVRGSNKLSNNYIDRINGSHLSRTMIDILLHIASSQDVYGIAIGVYYKDICDKVGCTPQSFYYAITRLEEEGLIKTDLKLPIEDSNKYCLDPGTERLNRKTITVTLIDNDFSEGKNAFDKGYLNLLSQDFLGAKFHALSAPAKKAYLFLQRFGDERAYRCSIHKLKDQFANKLNISLKSLRRCLKELKTNGLITIDKMVGPTGIYYSFKRTDAIFIEELGRQSENDTFIDHIMRFITVEYQKYIPTAKENVQELKNSIKNLFTNKNAAIKDYLYHFSRAARLSMRQKLNEQKRTGKDPGSMPIFSISFLNRYLSSLILGIPPVLPINI